MDRFSIFFKLTSNFPTSELNDIADILGKIFFKRFSRDFKIISTIRRKRSCFVFFSSSEFERNLWFIYRPIKDNIETFEKGERFYSLNFYESRLILQFDGLIHLGIDEALTSNNLSFRLNIRKELSSNFFIFLLDFFFFFIKIKFYEF